MNLKTTLALLLLAASGAGLWWVRKPAPPAEEAGSRAVLDSITRDSLRKVTIKADKGTTVLVRARDGKGWEMPGGWMAHASEVGRLIDVLIGLRSRFAAEAIGESGLARFGLERPAVLVTVETTDGKKHSLALGEPTGEDATRFDRPTYLRIDDRPEVLRLAPGLVAVLDRPPDFYQQRRLFPGRRVPREEGSSQQVDRAQAQAIELRERGEMRFRATRIDDRTQRIASAAGMVARAGNWAALGLAFVGWPGNQGRTVRLAGGGDDWHLAAPYRDPLDPAERDRLLEGLADVWVEKFLSEDRAKNLALLGLSPPVRTIVVTRLDGTPVTLHIGDEVPDSDRSLPRPGQPPKPSRSYARLEGQDRTFEISHPPGALSPSLDLLRDDQVARFSAEDARELTITTSKGAFTLKDTAARPARAEAPVQAKWRVVAPYDAEADNVAVSAVVNALAGLNAMRRVYPSEARLGWAVGTIAATAQGPLAALGHAWLCGDDGARRAFGLVQPAATIVLTVEEGKGDAPKKRKQFSIRLGRHDADGKKLFVTAGDWPRINEVSDALAGAVLGKSSMDFRSKRLLDVAATTIERVEVTRFDPTGLLALGNGLFGGLGALGAGQGPGVTLQRTASGWDIVAPVRATADSQAVENVLDRLARLEAVTFVAEPAPERLQPDYGLGVPPLRVRITFNDNSPPRTLLIGKRRPGDPGWYAQLAGSPQVFVLGTGLREDLARDALAYRPSSLWTVARNDIDRLKIARAGQAEYELVRKGDEWQVQGPFSVAAPRDVVDRLLQSLTAPRAEELLTHSTTARELAPFGLDKPAVRLTVTTKDKKSHTLHVGAPFSFGRFAWQGGTAPLMVVSDRLTRAIDQSALDFLDRQLVKFNSEQATGLTRRRGTDVLTLEKKDDAWRLVKPVDQPADRQKVPELFKLLGELRASKVVDYAPKAPAKYGLDKPEATLTVQMGADAKPAEHVVRLGSDAGGGDRYAQVAGSPLVGVLPAETVRQLLAGPLALRDHELARVPDADTIKLEAGTRKVTFAKPEGTWVVTQPAKLDADNDALESNLLGAFAPLRADEIVAEKATAAQLKAWGLDRPARRWQLLTGEKVELELEVGGTEKDGPRRYARVKGQEMVFLLSPKGSLVVLSEYRPRTVFKTPIDPAQITEVKFGHAKDGFTLTKDGMNWEVAGKPEVKLNAKTVSDTLAVLRELKLERYVADTGAQLKDFGLDPPALKLTVTTPDGTQELHVGGLVGATKERYAHLPASGRKDVFVMDATTATKLFRDLKALRAP